jgi:hypothetical protein
MRAFFRYVKLDQGCRCGSGRSYRACCFRGELIGFIIAMLILGLILCVHSEGWPSRIIRSTVGFLSWLCLFAVLREWFLRRRARKRKGERGP